MSHPPAPALSKARILSFLIPYIDVGAALVAAWLLVHVQLLGIFHVKQSAVAQVIASGTVFAVTALLTYLSHHYHWLPLTLAKARSSKAGAVTKEQILSFITPYLGLVGASIAAWLFVHLHVLGVFHLSQSVVANNIEAALVFVVTYVLAWAAHTFHWLPISTEQILRGKGAGFRQ